MVMIEGDGGGDGTPTYNNIFPQIVSNILFPSRT